MHSWTWTGPQYLKELLTPQPPARTLHSNNENTLPAPKTKHQGCRAWVAPRPWKALPDHLRASQNIGAWKHIYIRNLLKSLAVFLSLSFNPVSSFKSCIVALWHFFLILSCDMNEMYNNKSILYQFKISVNLSNWQSTSTFLSVHLSLGSFCHGSSLWSHHVAMKTHIICLTSGAVLCLKKSCAATKLAYLLWPDRLLFEPSEPWSMNFVCHLFTILREW